MWQETFNQFCELVPACVTDPAGLQSPTLLGWLILGFLLAFGLAFLWTLKGMVSD